MRALRPLNLLVVAALQLFTYYFLTIDTAQRNLVDPRLWFMVLASVLLTAAGYIFNDYCDTKADEINRPNRLGLHQRSITLFWLTYSVFTLMNLFLAWLVSTELLLIYFGLTGILVGYSLWLKRLPVIGNVVVSAIAGLSVYLIYRVFHIQYYPLVVFYAAFAAIITYIREMTKDLEDYSGDKAAGYATSAIIMGIRGARLLIVYVTVFALVSLIQIAVQWFIPQFQEPLKWIVAVYYGLCMIAPLIWVLVKAYKSTSQDDFAQLSAVLKYVMITGVLSMLFF